MLKHLLSYLTILSALLLAGCSDEIDFGPEGSFEANDGVVTVNLSVPGMTTSLSRAVDPEYKVNDITLLFYPAENTYDNTAPLQYEKIYLDDSGNANTGKNSLVQVTPTTLRLKFQLDNSLRSGSFRLYAFANLPSTLNLESTTVTGLNTTTLTTEQLGAEGELVMMTSVTSTTLAGNNNTITLQRVAAKVSVSDKQPSVDGDDSVISYYPMLLCGDPGKGYIVAPVNTDYSYRLPAIIPAESSFPSTLSSSHKAPCYLSPARNSQITNKFGGRLYVIVKAAYGSDEYYYRLDFCRKKVNDDDSETDEYLDALPNHWYQFVIEGVDGPGYAAPAEAALHPDNVVRYTIHDHAPESLNMTSDGFRELGVSHDIDYEGADTPADEWSDYALTVKLFSRDATETSGLTPDKVKALISVESPWLELGDPVEVTAEAETGSDYGTDLNDKGRVYRLPIRFNNTSIPGTLYNKITVDWLGLKRVVDVVWVRKFNGADVATASLKMTGTYGAGSVSDYWTFLSSTDDPLAVTGSNNLWGIQPEACNGQVRNQGFHFPVMYGTAGNYTRYTYTLTFDQGKFADTSLDYEVLTPSISGDDFIKNNVTVSKKSDKPATFEITSTTNSYTYAIGRLSVTFKFKTTPATSETYTYDLYHTGFFHKDSQSQRVDVANADPANYYYYEVIPARIDGHSRYILDRNLAAKSAQDYIRESDGATVTGNPDAAGGYFRVAQKPGNYQDPKLLAGVCPPGYTVPDKASWDAIRLSTAFHSDYDGRYYPACYDWTNGTRSGRIYFPKALMMENNSYRGESRSGYYWTSTAASGTEKDEIGRWINMFVLTGASTSFSNANVESYGLTLRCINVAEQTFETMTTAFNVSGATHVYLYVDGEDENTPRTSTTTWPGHAIGNYITMAPGNWFGFNYESTQFSPEQLKVMFNFVDENGIIHTYSRAADGTVLKTTDLRPDDCNGWKVVDDTDSHIVPPSSLILNENTSNQVDLVPATETALHRWWLCSGDDSDPHVWIYEKKPSAEQTYRIYWPTTYYDISGNSNHIYFYSPEPDNAIGSWPGVTGAVYSDNANYYIYEFSSALFDNATSFKCIINNGNNDSGNEKEISQIKQSDFSKVGNIYCAYFNNGWQSGIPPTAKRYRIYWPLIWGKNKSINLGSKRIFQAVDDTTIPDNIDDPLWGWNYVDFETDDPNAEMKFVSSTGLTTSLIGTVAEIFGSSGSAWLGYEFGESHQGIPSNPITPNKNNVSLATGCRRVYWIKPIHVDLRVQNTHAYYWNDVNGDAWPGNAMTQVIDGKDFLWYYDMPVGAGSIIFNCDASYNQGSYGLKQTENITIVNETYHLYSNKFK